MARRINTLIKKNSGYHTLSLEFDKDFKFLSAFHGLFTESKVHVWTEARHTEFKRSQSDGFITLTGFINGQEIGLIYNDFRINGGSFGKEVCTRVKAFVDDLVHRNIPLVFAIQSIGIRFMEGRTAFDRAFDLIPTLLKHQKHLPLITLSIGKTIGLGAVALRLGHYRLAISEQSEINLTGPEVIRTFFGEKFDFKSIASADVLFKNTALITEVVPSLPIAVEKIKILFSLSQERYSLPRPHYLHLTPSDRSSHEVLSHFDGPYLEVFPGFDPVVRTFIVQHQEQPIGVFLNPPGQVHNLISSLTLKRYQYALDFFKVLQLPIVSFLDTAGVDPRGIKTHDRDIISELVTTAGKIIEYPHAMMGFCLGRCYGGANVLGFPKIFGSLAVYAVEGSQIGIMHPALITKVLSGSPRLLSKWEEAKTAEDENLLDLIQEGTIDAKIKPSQIKAKLTSFISIAQMEKQVLQRSAEAIQEEHQQEEHR